MILGRRFKGQSQLWHSAYKALWARYRPQFLPNHFQTSHELKSVGYFVAKIVLVKSANQFPFEELCRTQYSLKYFSKSYIPSDRLEIP